MQTRMIQTSLTIQLIASVRISERLKGLQFNRSLAIFAVRYHG